MDERAAKEYLLSNDEHFRQLAAEHQQFEQKLAELTGKPFLSMEEQVEETRIKKKKLALKDQMQILISRCQSERSVN